MITVILSMCLVTWFSRSQIYFDAQENSIYRRIKLVKNSWFERQYVGSFLQQKILALKWENYVKQYCGTTDGKSGLGQLALGKSYSLNDYVKYTKHIGEQLGFANGHSMFDNGCGCGAFLAAFNQTYKNVRVGGLDLSTGAIAFAKKIFPKQKRNFQVGTVEHLSFVKDASYDHAMTFATFPYVSPEIQCQAVKEMLRIVKPGGSLYIGHNLEAECSENHIGMFTLPLCFWNERCLNGVEDVQQIYYIKEKELFDEVKYCPEKTAVFIHKKGGKKKLFRDARRYSCDSKYQPSGRETFHKPA